MERVLYLRKLGTKLGSFHILLNFRPRFLRNFLMRFMKFLIFVRWTGVRTSLAYKRYVVLESAIFFAVSKPLATNSSSFVLLGFSSAINFLRLSLMPFI